MPKKHKKKYVKNHFANPFSHQKNVPLHLQHSSETSIRNKSARNTRITTKDSSFGPSDSDAGLAFGVLDGQQQEMFRVPSWQPVFFVMFIHMFANFSL